ncbi:MAG: ribose ABC transporter [Burkholderiales bacterium]|nr:ribose ABC transporter [Burkholderiales bacterium]
MLKTIPPVLTPDLLWCLAAMGHGDRLVLANANYPAHSRHERVVTLAGVSLLAAARSIVQLMPIDDLGGPAAHRMVPDGRPDDVMDVHRDVQQELDAAEGRPVPLQPLERAAFFDLAASAFVVVATTDNRPFGCFVLTKGVVRAF